MQLLRQCLPASWRQAAAAAASSGGELSAAAAAAASTSAPAAAAPAAAVCGRARGMFVVVDVRNNNVDAAYGRLSRQCADNGLYKELSKRSHFVPRHEQKLEKARAGHNKRVGQQIRERLKWVVKRRHV